MRSIQDHADLPKDELELVIVDNNSDNPGPMFERLRRQWGDDIVLVKNPVNGGYGQGNNLGLRQSSAPVALIMNPDVRLYEPVFRKAAEKFEKDKATGMLGMVQMFSRTERSNHSFYTTWTMNGYLHLALFGICNRMDRYLPSCMYIQGSCFFLRKRMFEEAGMFDETNFMYGEEEDVYFRMRRLFGTRCFAFDRTLHYIHLAKGREPSVEHEKRLVKTNIALYEKKGVDRKTIIRHYLQNNRILLFRAALKSRQSPQYKVLSDFREYLESLNKEL